MIRLIFVDILELDVPNPEIDIEFPQASPKISFNKLLPQKCDVIIVT